MDMVVLYFILLVVSLVLFLLSTFQVHTAKINLLALGLACWVFVPLIQISQRL